MRPTDVATDQQGTYSHAALEWGRWLFAQECTFTRGVQKLNDLGEIGLPEIAFAGRSNVGKSSLINALTNRNTLARTSNTPGRTQQLNFFSLANRLLLVDMPGYGYAKVSKKMQSEWQDLLEAYFRGRPTLERAYVLVDSRVGMKESDKDVMQLFDKTAVSYQIVLTKVDKVGKTELAALITQLETLLGKHPAAHPKVMATSAEKNIGIAELRAEISQFVAKN
ncbi:ribosome biogenesis GTP-binding protein YihA/YsxC [Candidatus Paracaedibacter symbiosus]|uniref:ribosome biogenesis GTP-binding protein YihA/YsxC n=1 Tax=Candidatus Paracaedibacter symbiosus TaxID=244582 RepID=UPI00050951F1|nr:ribosome biogenesis GTP-binding protein YihA/YsxC [Candidatus Paracaedibacter symbiosus]